MSVLTRILTVLAVLLCAAVPGLAQAAGGLLVSPISLEFDQTGAARALEVSNPGNGITEVQIRLFAWTAQGGEDRTAPSTDIGFSPPMFRLAPGARQLVRFAATAPPDGRERAYRLYVEQLPTADEPGKLQMPVRMILPLFIEPSGAVRAAARRAGPDALRWQATFDPTAHRVRLVATNDGGRRLRLLNLAYELGGQTTIISPGLSGYVLAGAQHAWDFDYAGAPAALTLKADTDQGALVAQVAPPSG